MILLLIGLLFSSLTSWGMEAYAATGGNYPTNAVSQDSVLEGTVVSVDPTFERLTLRDDAGNITEISLSANTPVTGSYTQKNFRDLHPGDRIAVAYSPQQVQRVERR